MVVSLTGDRNPPDLQLWWQVFPSDSLQKVPCQSQLLQVPILKHTSIHLCDLHMGIHYGDGCEQKMQA